MPIEQKQLLVEWVNCRGLFKDGLGKFSIGYGAIFSGIRKNAFITTRLCDRQLFYVQVVGNTMAHSSLNKRRRYGLV